MKIYMTDLTNVIEIISDNLNLSTESKNLILNHFNSQAKLKQSIQDGITFSKEQLGKINQKNLMLEELDKDFAKKYSNNESLLKKYQSLKSNLAKVKINTIVKQSNESAGLNLNDKIISQIIDLVDSTVLPITNMLEKKNLKIESTGGGNNILKYLKYKKKYMKLKSEINL